MKLRILLLAGVLLPAFANTAEAFPGHGARLRSVPHRPAGLLKTVFVPPRALVLPRGFYFRGRLVFSARVAVGWFCDRHHDIHYYKKAKRKHRHHWDSRHTRRVVFEPARSVRRAFYRNDGYCSRY